jgi:hypothetical protein
VIQTWQKSYRFSFFNVFFSRKYNTLALINHVLQTLRKCYLPFIFGRSSGQIRTIYSVLVTAVYCIIDFVKTMIFYRNQNPPYVFDLESWENTSFLRNLTLSANVYPGLQCIFDCSALFDDPILRHFVRFRRKSSTL